MWAYRMLIQSAKHCATIIFMDYGEGDRNSGIENSRQELILHNQAIASYLKDVLTKIPVRTHPEFSPGVNSNRFDLAGDPNLQSIEFFDLPGGIQGFFGNTDGYGFHIIYRPDVPENLIQYKDHAGKPHIAKKVRSTFRFSENGDTNFVHTMPDLTNPSSRIDLTNEDLQATNVQINLGDEDIRERITQLRPPAEDEPSGGVLMELKIKDDVWIEAVLHALVEFHKRYPDQSAPVEEFIRDFVRQKEEEEKAKKVA